MAAGISLADVAAGLATTLTTGTRAAAAEGTTLLIADRTGAAFPAALAVRVQSPGSAVIRSASTQSTQPATTAFVLSGTPKSGDRWLVTINGTTQVVTVGGATDTLAEIVQALAEAIDAGASFTVFHAGSTLYITERDGVAFTADALVALATTTGGSISAPVSGTAPVATHEDSVVTVALNGTPYVGQIWRLSAAGNTYQIVASAAVDTLAEIAAALASAVNVAAGDLVATRDGANLLLVSRSGSSFAVSIDPSVTRMLSLAGSTAIGDIWAVTLEFGGISRTYSHAVSGVTTLAQIASSLAATINEDLGAGFMASSAGDDLLVAHRAGVEFDAIGSVAPRLLPAGAIDLTAGTDAAGNVRIPVIDITLGGTPVSGARWTLNLSVGGKSFAFEIGVTTGQSFAAIAAAYAAQINAMALAAGSPLAGLAADVSPAGKLEIVDIAGRRLDASIELVTVAAAQIDAGTATTTLADLTGMPVAGELWKLWIGDLSFAITVAATPQTLEQLASAFAAQVNAAPSAARYTATADGSRLIIVDRQGGIFASRIDAGTISRIEGHADIVLDYALTATQMQSRLQSLYGFDDIVVGESRNAGDVTYTVTFVLDQAGKNQQQIMWTETSGLLPSPNASVAVRTATLCDGATVNAGINTVQTLTLAPNLTGGSFTLWFRIENESGELILVETAAIDFDASALDVFKALSPILNPNGATIDIDAAFDFATRTPSKPYTDNFSVRKVGNTFIIIFQGAHRQLSIHDIDMRGLSTEESGATQHEGRDTTVTLATQVAGDPLAEDGLFEIDLAAPRATMIDIALPARVVGQTWTITLTLRGIASTHSTVVLAGDSPAAIAVRLAALINSDAADVFTALGDSGVLVLANRDGSAFKTALTVAGTSIGIAAIDRSTATETALNLSGTPKAGEVWSVTLNDGTTAPT
ncbi:hypothetical protein JZU69_03450, partial [bacterium]|nr:hypothetical protein [bacterium]